MKREECLKKESAKLEVSTLEDEGGEDDELVLITKAINVMYKEGKLNKKNFSSLSKDKSSNRVTEQEMKDVTCFKCNKKGHFAKNCYSRGSSNFKRREKAYVFAWDNLEEDPEAWSSQNNCLMAIGDDAKDVEEEEVTNETILKSLTNYSKPHLIKLLSRVLHDNV